MRFEPFRPPRWRRWAAVAVVAAGILYASVLAAPGPGLSRIGPLGLVGTDKWLHGLAYLGLAGTLAAALAPDREAATVAAAAFVLATGYGFGVEAAQAFVPVRDVSLADAAANATGGSVGAVGWWVAARLARPESSVSSDA